MQHISAQYDVFVFLAATGLAWLIAVAFFIRHAAREQKRATGQARQCNEWDQHSTDCPICHQVRNRPTAPRRAAHKRNRHAASMSNVRNLILSR